MVAQVHPFSKAKEGSVPWGGIKTPDPLRDDPSHPHASLGHDYHRVGFADGGFIDGNEADGFAHGGKIAGKMAEPERAAGGPPRKIATENPPGGKHTPGAKADALSSGTKDLTIDTAKSRLKGRALKLHNAERAAEGLPPLTQE